MNCELSSGTCNVLMLFLLLLYFGKIQLELKSTTDAPVGQPTRNPSKLDQAGPGANASKDSDAAAYAKLGAVVVGAGAITWFVVPVVSSAAEKLLG